MSYDEEQARRSRVVVETPNERREVVHSQSVRGDRNDNGISAGMVGVLVVVAIALITMLVLFWMSSQQTNDSATVATQPPTTIVEQPAPAQQPPVIIQQPAPVTTQPAPIIVTPPAGGATGTESQPANMDSTIQSEIDKRLRDDPAFSSLGITATVINGKVMLIGTVNSEEMKSRIERMVRQMKGVKEVDNQISVIPA